MANMGEVRVEETIASTPLSLYRLVSDVTRMGEWSPETTSCRWLGGATGPSVGARFKGSNRQGWRRWSTTCTVVDAEPGHRFTFEVNSGPLPISRWSYEFNAVGEGCRVTETWTDRRPGWIVPAGAVVMGIRNRDEHNRAGMRATLAALRRAKETTDPKRAEP
jgi:hypothetical protein